MARRTDVEHGGLPGAITEGGDETAVHAADGVGIDGDGGVEGATGEEDAVAVGPGVEPFGGEEGDDVTAAGGDGPTGLLQRLAGAAGAQERQGQVLVRAGRAGPGVPEHPGASTMAGPVHRRDGSPFRDEAGQVMTGGVDLEAGPCRDLVDVGGGGGLLECFEDARPRPAHGADLRPHCRTTVSAHQITSATGAANANTRAVVSVMGAWRRTAATRPSGPVGAMDLGGGERPVVAVTGQPSRATSRREDRCTSRAAATSPVERPSGVLPSRSATWLRLTSSGAIR